MYTGMYIPAKPENPSAMDCATKKMLMCCIIFGDVYMHVHACMHDIVCNEISKYYQLTPGQVSCGDNATAESTRTHFVYSSKQGSGDQ